MIFSNLLLASIVVTSIFGHRALASSTDSAALMALVDDLNERYRSGKPTNNFGEAGIFLRIIDSFCGGADPNAPPCDYNMANSPPGTILSSTFLGESMKKPNFAVSLKNDMFDTPKDYGDEIPIFESWNKSGPFGPAAGVIYFPCAAEKATRCMWPVDGNTDRRNLTCSRQDPDALNGIFSVKGCTECAAEQSGVISAEDNPITNRAVGRFDDMPNDRTNTTSLQIELLLNRENINMTFDDIFETSGSLTKMKERESPSSCDLCKSSSVWNVEESFFNWVVVMNEAKWYEGPGYYSLLDQEDTSSLIQPRNELKEMMEAQARHFGVNRKYTDDVPKFVIGNEFAMDEDTIQ